MLSFLMLCFSPSPLSHSVCLIYFLHPLSHSFSAWQLFAAFLWVSEGVCVSVISVLCITGEIWGLSGIFSLNHLKKQGRAGHFSDLIYDILPNMASLFFSQIYWIIISEAHIHAIVLLTLYFLYSLLFTYFLSTVRSKKLRYIYILF